MLTRQLCTDYMPNNTYTTSIFTPTIFICLFISIAITDICPHSTP